MVDVHMLIIYAVPALCYGAYCKILFHESHWLISLRVGKVDGSHLMPFLNSVRGSGAWIIGFRGAVGGVEVPASNWFI